MAAEDVVELRYDLTSRDVHRYGWIQYWRLQAGWFIPCVVLLAGGSVVALVKGLDAWFALALLGLAALLGVGAPMRFGRAMERSGVLGARTLTVTRTTFRLATSAKTFAGTWYERPFATAGGVTALFWRSPEGRIGVCVVPHHAIGAPELQRILDLLGPSLLVV